MFLHMPSNVYIIMLYYEYFVLWNEYYLIGMVPPERFDELTRPQVPRTRISAFGYFVKENNH